MTREEAIEAWNRGTVMREILFREKRLDNGEWVGGNFYEKCPFATQGRVKATNCTKQYTAI